ncbi:protein kinase-like [Colletotrichum asianum]
MDPLSIAGLTIAVLDQLWKIGNRTAELVSDYREFDTDTRILENKIRDENNRTRALQLLLFELSSTYGGKSLFEQFDKDVQDQILVFLEQASDVLEQAYRLLNRRQKSDIKGKDPQSPAKPNFMSTISPAPSSTSLSSGDSILKRPKSFQRIKWSLMDKKRVGTIIEDFSELNGRIHESIKLWCPGTSIGVNLQHLNRLETDDNSRALGFDVDARLQLTISQNQTTATSLEMNDPPCEDVSRMPKVLEANSAFLTGKTRQSPVPMPLDDRTRTLVDMLANLLHQPKEIAFRTPSCHGWVRQMQQNRVAYMFSLPEAADSHPTSLLDILSANNSHPPSLSQRFCLAAKLSRCISQLHLVKWIFNKIHDIYALGVVLLEIVALEPKAVATGVHSEKSGFSKVRDPHAIKKHLIKHAEKRLGAKMGDKYQKVVLKCLKGDFEVVDDIKEDLKLQQAFRANVVDLLQRSADSV